MFMTNLVNVLRVDSCTLKTFTKYLEWNISESGFQSIYYLSVWMEVSINNFWIYIFIHETVKWEKDFA